jgi:hypothetical protein
MCVRPYPRRLPPPTPPPAPGISAIRLREIETSLGNSGTLVLAAGGGNELAAKAGRGYGCGDGGGGARPLVRRRQGTPCFTRPGKEGRDCVREKCFSSSGMPCPHPHPHKKPSIPDLKMRLARLSRIEGVAPTHSQTHRSCSGFVLHRVFGFAWGGARCIRPPVSRSLVQICPRGSLLPIIAVVSFFPIKTLGIPEPTTLSLPPPPPPPPRTSARDLR